MSAKKMKILKWSLLAIVVITVAVAIVGYKMYNKPHRSVANADAVAVNASVLFAAYETDEEKSNKVYLDKVLNVFGEVSAVSKNQKGEAVITLKGGDLGGVICTLEGSAPWEIKEGTSVRIQGICTGYLTDVVLVRCYIN